MDLDTEYKILIDASRLESGLDVRDVILWAVVHCASFTKTKIISFDHRGFVSVDFIFTNEMDSLLFTLRFK